VVQWGKGIEQRVISAQSAIYLTPWPDRSRKAASLIHIAVRQKKLPREVCRSAARWDAAQQRSRTAREHYQQSVGAQIRCALTDAIKPLIAAGADLEARDRNGDTALIHEAFVEAMMRELLANGADPAAISNKGDTELQRAEQYQCKPCAALIASALKKRSDASKN
jgi:ankyrin repeat protein